MYWFLTFNYFNLKTWGEALINVMKYIVSGKVYA